MPPYLTKQRVAARYDVTPRTIERWWKDGRLPPPDYPVGPQKPYADQEKLEAVERAAITRPVAPRTSDKSEQQAA